MVKIDRRPCFRSVASATGLLWIVFLVQISHVDVVVAINTVFTYVFKGPFVLLVVTIQAWGGEMCAL